MAIQEAPVTNRFITQKEAEKLIRVAERESDEKNAAVEIGAWTVGKGRVLVNFDWPKNEALFIEPEMFHQIVTRMVPDVSKIVSSMTGGLNPRTYASHGWFYLGSDGRGRRLELDIYPIGLRSPSLLTTWFVNSLEAEQEEISG